LGQIRRGMIRARPLFLEVRTYEHVPGIGRLEERDMADLSDPGVDVFYSLASFFIYYYYYYYYYYQLV